VLDNVAAEHPLEPRVRKERWISQIPGHNVPNATLIPEPPHRRNVAIHTDHQSRHAPDLLMQKFSAARFVHVERGVGGPQVYNGLLATGLDNDDVAINDAPARDVSRPGQRFVALHMGQS
jgi:hypothetical protein